MKIHVDCWDVQSEQAKQIRYEVFCAEQKVPKEMELDEMDAVCRHAIAINDQGDAVGTGRLLPDGHIGRMAVRKIARGSGVGGAILQCLMDEAHARGDREVILSAQTHAEGFYTHYGFVREGEEYLDANIPHITMRHVFA